MEKLFDSFVILKHISVDNEGNVIGTVSWSSKVEQSNGAMSLDAMCDKILTCEGKYYWEW